MAKKLRSAHGMREKAPNVWEMYASAGRDPVTGKYRQVSEIFHGNLRDAKTARAEFAIKAKKGKHTGTTATVETLCNEWLTELRRKGRSPTTIDEYERRYNHDIHTAIGHLPVTKVTTKTLTDLYGEHQKRGSAAGSVRKIHAVISSMMTQACKWGWRNDNPAAWADPPPLESQIATVPTPDEVRQLMQAASQSTRPIYRDVVFLTATTGIRRGELCGLRRDALSRDKKQLMISRSIARAKVDGKSIWVEKSTKNRKRRPIQIDERTMQILDTQIKRVDRLAEQFGSRPIENAYIFTDHPTGAEFWKPHTISQYFLRLCARHDLSHLSFKSLRSFMDTYGQELGFSLAQVSVRAGHDPAVASKHYTGRVSKTDTELADAISLLIEGPGE